MISHEQLNLLFMGSPIGALKTLELSSNSMLRTLDRLGNLLVLLKVRWKMSTYIRITPVKTFLYQTTHSKVMIKNAVAPNMFIIG